MPSTSDCEDCKIGEGAKNSIPHLGLFWPTGLVWGSLQGDPCWGVSNNATSMLVFWGDFALLTMHSLGWSYNDSPDSFLHFSFQHETCLISYQTFEIWSNHFFFMISSLYMTWNALEASMFIHFDSSESFQRIEFDSEDMIHSRFQHNLSVIKLVDWHVIKIYQVELLAF